MKKGLIFPLMMLPLAGQAQEIDSLLVKNDTTAIDTTLQLGEVKITAARVIHKVDRDIRLP